MYQDGLLSSKSILVTGGGSGLGLSMAAKFASLGATVHICGRNLEKLHHAKLEINQKLEDAKVEIHQCDVQERGYVEKMMETIWSNSPLDTLVNCAAANFIARTETMSSRAVNAIIHPTLYGPLNCTLEAGKRWIDARKQGCVLSILSTSAFTGRAYTVPSAMAKAAVLAMTRSLAVEWGSKNIRMVAIAPGPIPTEAASARLRPNKGLQSLEDKIPVGRVGLPEELADLATFLISDQAAFVNGECVALDGGMHLRSSGAEDLLAWSETDWQAIHPKK